MRKLYLFIGALAAALVFLSCSASVEPVAEQVTFEEIKTIPGYTWFGNEYDEYVPDAQTIEEIKSRFDQNRHKFIVFVKPSCSCPNNKIERSPRFMKILNQAGIPFELCSLYTIQSVSNKHPYQEMIDLKALPAIIVLKSETPVYSVTDTINALLDGDPYGNFPIENTFVKALEK